MEENALAIVQNRFQGDMIQLGLAPGTVQAILAWAKGSSDSSSPRFSDLVNDKSRIVGDFLCFVKKSPEQSPARLPGAAARQRWVWSQLGMDALQAAGRGR